MSAKTLQMLPDCFADRTTHASEARENQCKNRYPDIKAYDQTRVKLAQVDSIVGSDYINANYVMGYKVSRYFCIHYVIKYCGRPNNLTWGNRICNPISIELGHSVMFPTVF